MIYTMLGGVQAVTWTDVKQMYIIVFGLVAVAIALVLGLPSDVGLGEALQVAGATGRMQAFDFRFTLNETYTFWSGLIGGTFLMMSYFGTDQSQVQRFLTARSVNEARSSLLMSAYWKIPLQALILLIGVLVFVYYTFQAPPLFFNPAHAKQVQAEQPVEYAALEAKHRDAVAQREAAARSAQAGSANGEAAFRDADKTVTAVHDEALALARNVTNENARDVNYIIPTFVLTVLPIGLVGIFIAGVMAAAMSSIAAELNSLATSTVIDFYRRWFRPVATDTHYLTVSKGATMLWGIFACIVATYAATLGSLIEVVNRFGSFFYGSILGVFLLAMIPRARATGAFIGMIAGISAVAAVNFGRPSIAFLWQNVVGAVVVVIVGLIVSTLIPAPKSAQPAR
jgi:SSS family solute:Na+ symporter